MKKFSVILATLLLSLFTFSAHSEEGKGANMELFPAPKADASKAARPAKPELTEPSYRALIQGDTVTLKWKEVPAANAYHLQLAIDPNFKWLVVNEELLKANSFDVKGLEKAKHYFWRVAALKTENVPTFMKGWYSLSTFETP